MRAVVRFLSSLWLGISLIALLTVACIYGSIVSSDENRGGDYALEYVFHTWWFLGLMGLLLVNLALCSWEKSYIALTLYKKKNIIPNKGFYERMPHHASMPWKGDLGKVQNLLKKRYTVAAFRDRAGYAQRGLFGRCGATIIHIGLLWTMAAGYYRILADDFGWGVFDSTVILPEGETTDSYFSRIDRLKKNTEDNLRENKMPITLRALDFRADYHPHSTVAQHFASLVELRDGDHRQISEVTMRKPLIYKGYKITQNSFSENERVIRGRFRVRNVQTGESEEVDASPNDPVQVKVGGAEDLFLQVSALAPNAEYKIMDLGAQKVVAQGSAGGAGAQAFPLSPAELEHQLMDSKYSVMVAALFPNFRINEQNEPSTVDEKFENPAVFVMLFKNGKANGYTWLFMNETAQNIIGQPHPEMEMHFKQYRRVANASGEGGLRDYEVQVEFFQKEPRKSLGEFWVQPGKLLELQGVEETVLQSPNVNVEHVHGMDEHDHGTTGSATDTITPNPHGGAGQESAAGGGTTSTDDGATTGAAELGPAIANAPPATETTSTATTTAPAAQSTGPYEVTYLGRTTGHVTFLGFMKDPSVNWLFTGCLIIIGGTLTAFLITYREVWVYYDEEEGRLYLATQVRGTSPSSHREFDRLVNEIARLE